MKDFASHCKDNTEDVKRDHKRRLKSHKARVASRVAAESIDSDPDSDDTLSTLLRELDLTEARLRKTNKELKDADEHVVSKYLVSGDFLYELSNSRFVCHSVPSTFCTKNLFMKHYAGDGPISRWLSRG
jgi:hypothetical protein